MSALVPLVVAEGQDRADAGSRDLLASLPEEVLAGLLKTVTNSLVNYGSVPLDENGKETVNRRTHAINSIMMYSDGNVWSLLNRTRLTKNYLSDYLNKKGYKMTIQGSKHSLCEDVLNYWGIHSKNENVRVIEDHATPTRCNNQEALCQTSRATNGTPTSLTQSHPSAGNQFTSGQTVIATRIQVLSPEHDHAVSLRRQEEEVGQRLGHEFAKWYYERLNNLTDFSATHFWPQSHLRIEYIFAAQPDNAIIDEVANNGEAVCAKIKDLRAIKELWFEVNYQTGIRGTLNPHGLAQIMVCGVLYDFNSKLPVGVFEQMFGLMKDISDHQNFKIKYTVIRLREGAKLALENSPPEMTDSSLVGIVEEVD